MSAYSFVLMNEKQFYWLCCWLFLGSFVVLLTFILITPSYEFDINPYTSQIGCEGSCSFRAQVNDVSDKNTTVFYKLDKNVSVDAVLFVGTKKPEFSSGDCVVVSGSAQTYKGKQSIVIQTIRKC